MELLWSFRFFASRSSLRVWVCVSLLYEQKKVRVHLEKSPHLWAKNQKRFFFCVCEYFKGFIFRLLQGCAHWFDRTNCRILGAIAQSIMKLASTRWHHNDFASNWIILLSTNQFFYSSPIFVELELGEWISWQVVSIQKKSNVHLKSIYAAFHLPPSFKCVATEKVLHFSSHTFMKYGASVCTTRR